MPLNISGAFSILEETKINMAELLKLYPENPSGRIINKIVETLKDGGVIIYPTDTVYSFGCDINQPKAIERIARIKDVKPEKANFSIIFHDLSMLSEYTQQIDNPTYKLLKRTLPGPYTYILNASNAVPKIFKNNKKTIGIRIPDNNIPREIVRALGNPIIASSVHDEDQIIDYTTDPELIKEHYNKLVDLVIDGGIGDNSASTVVDMTGNEPEIMREGKGSTEVL